MRKRKKVKPRNPVARDLQSPLFRQRVVTPKTKKPTKHKKKETEDDGDGNGQLA